MSLAHYALAASILIGGSVSAAPQPDLVIPAAAAADGASGSRWLSEVILHNAGSLEAPVTLTFHDSTGARGEVSATLAPRSTKVLSNVIESSFGLDNVTGAILIETDDAFARKLAVTSRTYNVGGFGEFGQDIPALAVSSSLQSGDTGVLTAPSSVADARFNFGLYASEASTIQWRLIRNDGTVAAEVERSYTIETHTQHNNGVAVLFGVPAQNGDVVHARVQAGRLFLYGSAINNISGDPSFVPAIRTRENLSVDILGVDLNEDGAVDVFDADGNGLLDEPIILFTSTFPNYFRIIATDPEGEVLTYTLVNPSRDAQLIDEIGTVQWYPGADVKGSSGSLTVRVSDGTDRSELIVPVIFR